MNMNTKQTNTFFEIIRFVLAVLIALGISFVIICITSKYPVQAMINLFIGPFTSIRRFSTVLETMIPLSFAGLAVCIMFRADQFNISAEGAMYCSAMAACAAGVYIPGPPILVLALAIGAGAITGAVICWIPGILKVKWGANELVSSLMLNFVCLYMGLYVFNNFMRDPNSGAAASLKLPPGVNLGNIIPRTRLHYGIIILFVCVALAYVYIYKTKWGYKLRITGSNSKFAAFSGIGVVSVVSSSQMLGGVIAGIGGSVEMLGMYDRFLWTALPGYGFDGVIIAIIAKNNPLLVPVAAFFISFIKIGADCMYKQSNVAAEIVTIIQGLIILFVAANAFLAKQKHKMIIKSSTGSAIKEVV